MKEEQIIKKRDSWYAKWFDDIPESQKITRKGTVIIAAACRLHDATYPDKDNAGYVYLGDPLEQENGYAERLRYIPDRESFIEAYLLMRGQIKRAIRRAKKTKDAKKRIKIMGKIMSEPMFVPA